MSFLKKLQENRAEKVQEMETLVNTAKTEERAMAQEELEKFKNLEKEIEQIDSTIAAEERARKEKGFKAKEEEKEPTTEELEERAFCNYILNKVEERAGEKNLTMGDNGAIIHTTIANRIIKEVKDRCPILEKATMYHVKGKLKIPVWGKNDEHDIKVAFSEEFTALTADSGKFTSVDLDGFLAGALTLIGESLENNGSFSVVDFVISQMAEEIAIFLEGKLLNGESGKNEGALATNNVLVAAAATAINPDELIALQAKVKQVYQKDACWTMHPDTFVVLKQLKDGNGRYLLQDDISGEFPYKMLGKPVYLSDNMPQIAADAAAILYGDYSGLSVNMRENIEIKVLREKYADMHAIGILSWLEFDSKVSNHQKLAVLKMKSA